MDYTKFIDRLYYSDVLKVKNIFPQDLKSH